MKIGADFTARAVLECFMTVTIQVQVENDQDFRGEILMEMQALMFELCYQLEAYKGYVRSEIFVDSKKFDDTPWRP